MRRIILGIWLGLLGTSTLVAQGAGKGPAGASAVEHKVQIDSDQVEYQLLSHLVTYTGHVRVLDPQMTLTCGYLRAQFATNTPPADTASSGTNSARRLTTLIARTNVVMVQGVTRATAEQAVYTASNNLVVLTGKPVMETPQGTLWADVIILDRAKNELRATNERMVLRPGATSGPGLLLPSATPKPAPSHESGRH